MSERQVRRWVRERRLASGELVEEAFVTLVHDPGAEAEVDRGQADVVVGGVQHTVFLFLMRACFSGACFVIAFARETQQAFLEAHVAAFGFFGGAFATIRQAPGRQRAADRQLDRNNRGQAAFQEPAGREGRTAVRSSA